MVLYVNIFYRIVFFGIACYLMVMDGKICYWILGGVFIEAVAPATCYILYLLQNIYIILFHYLYQSGAWNSWHITIWRPLYHSIWIRCISSKPWPLFQCFNYTLLWDWPCQAFPFTILQSGHFFITLWIIIDRNMLSIFYFCQVP